MGFAATALGWESLAASGLYFAGLGLGLALSGALTLRSYLRQTEPPEEGQG